MRRENAPMFDLSTFHLQESIAKYNQTKFLEAQRITAEGRQQFVESVSEHLAAQYRSLYETEFSSRIERKFITEQATITAVKNTIFNIFESALLLDESVKAEYRDNIKFIFETNFNTILAESGVKSLAQFKTFTSKSNKMLNEVTERANEFSVMNESNYHNIIQTNYSSTSLDKMIFEAFTMLSEADTPEENKKDMLKRIMTGLQQDLNTANALQAISINTKTARAIQLGVTIGSSLGITFYLWLYNPLLAILGPLFALGSHYGGEKLGEMIDDKMLGSKNDAAGYKKYKDSLIEVKDALSKLLTKFEKGSSQYKRLAEKIDSANRLIEKVEAKIAKFNDKKDAKAAKKSLKEASYIEFLTEADHTLSVSIDNKDLDNIADAVKSKMKDDINSFDPFKALEDIKIINNLVRNDKYYQTALNDKASGSYTVHLIVRGLKSNNISDSIESQYVMEAKKYSGSMEKIIQQALRDKADNDPAIITNIQRQKKYLDSFIKQYDLNKDKVKTGKLIKESEYNSIFINEAAITINNFVTNIMEAANYVLIYETSKDDLNYFAKIVRESGCTCEGKCNGKCKGALTEADHEDMDTLVSVIRNESSSSMPEQAYAIEAAVYEKLYMANPLGLSEAVGTALKSGNYPKLDDFMDDDEISLLDSIATIGGKAKIVDVIRNKIVDVIEKEEARTKKLEEDEEKLLARLNKNSTGEGIQESAVKVNLGGINVPKNLFESIVMNRSKKYIAESIELGTGFDINLKKDVIMSEAITLYTIFETFNTLNFGTFDSSKINKLTNDYYYNKI
jgi:flagellar biosynthesis regulator FlbT